jgi:ribosome-associated protein
VAARRAGGVNEGPHNAPMAHTTDFALRGEHIALDALLKATGLAASGGDAKALILAGDVKVNDAIEVRRGRKLRAGDVVVVGAMRVQVRGA